MDYYHFTIKGFKSQIQIVSRVLMKVIHIHVYMTLSTTIKLMHLLVWLISNRDIINTLPY